MATHQAARDEPRAGAARPTRVDARERLLAGLAAEERRLALAGISTAVLQGGEGHPIVLLHGPGEFAAKWWRVIPELVERHRVVAPDLPAHGASQTPAEPLDEARVLAWLAELIDRTCPSPPTLVGHVLGGAIAARFAVEHGDRLERLLLVDTLGLARFRPRPRFAATLIGLQLRPTERAYNRFMNHCSADLPQLREDMGERWEPYMSYSLDLARSPSAKAMRQLMRDVGLPPLPADRLARIGVPTTLIWGRQDEANNVRIAQAASDRYQWPLHIIEDCADDPARDHPEAFLRALRAAMAGSHDHRRHDMTRHLTPDAPTPRSPGDYGGPPPANYERYFVPTIGRPLAVDLVHASALQAGERVLDVACGTGVVARLAAEQVGTGGAVTGLDAHPGMLAVARSVPAEGATIEWHQADAAATGLPDAAYDAVLCQLGLQCFADRTAALREMRRVLRPGGRIAVNVAGPPPPIFEILRQALADHVSPDAAGFIATVFSLTARSELESLLERAGFEEISAETRTRRLPLPPPEQFLPQYVSSTPLAPAVGALDEGTRTALVRDVVGRWEPFVGDDGAMVMQLEVPLATAR